MKDVNVAILKAFYDAITGVVDPSVKVFEGMAPPTNTSTTYVIINYPVTTDKSDKQNFGSNTTVQIDVNHSSDTVVNSSLINTICNNIYPALIPENKKPIVLNSEFQAVDGAIFNDRTEAPTEIANKVFLRRILIFKFTINQR